MPNDQKGLFDEPEDALAILPRAGWPNPKRFPFNGPGQTVEKVLLADLRADGAPLIVTGYASLDQLIAYLADIAADSDSVRMLLGNEPYPSSGRAISVASRGFPEEVRRYWLARGVSLRLSAHLIHAIELLRAGRVQVRFVGGVRLHAKIYCTERAATIGSSNFSRSGLQHQLEGNARFEPAEPRFRETWRLAEHYWNQGQDYNAELVALLEQLLRVVDWRETLARACAELLEGEWAQAELARRWGLDETPLWPSQRKGIAQALWLLDNLGSVLVADATGSGKTRMGAHLVRAATDRIWRSGRARKGRPLVICPPAVQAAWDCEADRCDLPLKTLSHGVLSQREGATGAETIAGLRRAQILAVDEAHNFLNLHSRRTQHCAQQRGRPHPVVHRYSHQPGRDGSAAAGEHARRTT